MKTFRRFSQVLLLVSAAALASAAPVPPTPAPVWNLKDVNGHDVSSEQLKGKVVVVDFWATWCPPCRQEIPGYVDLQKKYAQDGLVDVGISLDAKGPAVVKQFVDKYQVSYLIVMGTEEVTKAFGGMDAIPTTFIIDRAGQIRERKVGSVPREVFEKSVLTYLKPAAAPM